MRWLEYWDQTDVLPCRCSTPLLGVTLFHFLEEEVNELPGTRGDPTTISHRYSSLWQTPQSLWRAQLHHWSDLILLYDRTSSLEDINQAKKHLFAQKGRSIENIPPTKAALVQHIKRAVYQAGYCWAQAMTSSPDLPCPSEWGWKRKEPCSWEANWTSLPEATVACRELLRCGCKKGCKKNCKCSKAALQCTALCQCGGQCTEN